MPAGMTGLSTGACGLGGVGGGGFCPQLTCGVTIDRHSVATSKSGKARRRNMAFSSWGYQIGPRTKVFRGGNSDGNFSQAGRLAGRPQSYSDNVYPSKIIVRTQTSGAREFAAPRR